MENKAKARAKIYRALAQGFNDLAEIEELEVSAPATTPTAKASAPATKATASGTLDKAQLDAMKYNDLKSFAKKAGVDPTGTREAITERLLDVVVEAPAEEPSEEPAEQGVDIQAQVEAAVAEMSVEEIGDLLKDVGITPTGKRQALIAKLVKAVEEGKIAFGDDDETPAEEPAEEPTEEVEVEDYFPEGEMTEARETTCNELDKELRAEYKKKGISDKEVAETCEAFYLDHEGYDSTLPKNEKLDMYIAATQRMIDDEGEQPEFKEPYEMNGQNACCGHYLKELENGNLYCEVCAQEFEMGE